MEQGHHPGHGAKRGYPLRGNSRRAVILGGLGGGGRYEPRRKRDKSSKNFAKRMNQAADPIYAVPKTSGHDATGRVRPPNHREGNRRHSSLRYSGPLHHTISSYRKKRRPEETIDVSRFVNRAVTVEEERPYVPTHQFTDFAIDNRLKMNIAAKGYQIPTAIQDLAIPEGLRGRDVIGIANTGEGKTAAFLLPLLHKMLHHPLARVLVVVPTRELALQIDDEFMGFARGLGIYSALLVGGVSINTQIERLRRNVRMVIGTPGRLKDLIERGDLDLSGFQHLVLDEADRMLDMGFINDITYVIARLPRDRHTMFFSATFSREIEKLAHTLLSDPVRISVKKQDTSRNVEQDVIRVRDRVEKFNRLCTLLKQPGFGKVLIFGRTKHGVERLGRILQRGGFRAASIHGDKTQPQRQRALRDFKEERVQILVATDVAARGLDIPNVSHVINYDVPLTYDDYVHRIGRTGRAGKKGVALTFVEGI